MKTLLTIFSIVFCNIITAQNLIPNPGFELYNNCQYFVGVPGVGFPINIVYSPNYDSFPTTKYWVTPLVNNTPDYFNVCDTTAYGHGVPNNCLGSQTPHAGDSYAGVAIYMREQGIYVNYREFIESKLIQQLIAGHQYHIHF